MKQSTLILSLCLLLSAPLHARFTEYKERHLGPTGMIGITSPTEIKITKISAGSPADGKIKEGDVLVKAGGMAFNDATRKQFALAVDAAESEQAGGVLSLTLKDGRKVDLKLEVLGEYSKTAPFNCAKTDAIIARTADAIIAKKKYGRGDMNIGLLGLLATGEEKYVKHVGDVIHAANWAKPDLQLTLESYGRTAWSWGYHNLLLGEYYLLTGDKSVLPAITTVIANSAARRRAMAWIWARKPVRPNHP